MITNYKLASSSPFVNPITMPLVSGPDVKGTLGLFDTDAEGLKKL